MFLVVGLGNPGAEYVGTRHNVGFMAADAVHEKYGFGAFRAKFDGLIAEGNIEGEKVYLLKPQTFMNLSGNSVVKAAQFYKILPQNVVVIHDDMDLPVGKIRIRTSGSSAGQKGMGDIILKLANQNINRIRVGIGKHNKIDTIDYVLGKIHGEELEIYQQSLSKAAKAALDYGDGCTMAYIMNHYNG